MPQFIFFPLFFGSEKFEGKYKKNKIKRKEKMKNRFKINKLYLYVTSNLF